MILTENKKGFTLVEILLVIFIIALLSVLAIGGYGEYRKLTLLNYAADSIVSQIAGLKDSVVYGTAISECSGVLFDGEIINMVSASYDPKKKWDNTVNDFVKGDCDTASLPEIPFEFDQNIEFESAKYKKGTSYGLDDGVALFFVPPDGRIVIKNTGFSADYDDYSAIEEINFIIKYKDTNTDKYKRLIKINPVSGSVTWQHYELPSS